MDSKPKMVLSDIGTKMWVLNGKRHREDGPAIEWEDGTKQWWVNGKLHREDGPAIVWEDGTKEWWANGDKITENEFNARKRVKDAGFGGVLDI